jgi:hypothetical protein
MVRTGSGVTAGIGAGAGAGTMGVQDTGVLARFSRSVQKMVLRTGRFRWLRKTVPCASVCMNVLTKETFQLGCLGESKVSGLRTLLTTRGGVWRCSRGFVLVDRPATAVRGLGDCGLENSPP